MRLKLTISNPMKFFKLENPNLLSGKPLDEATVKNVAESSEKLCEFDEKNSVTQ